MPDCRARVSGEYEHRKIVDALIASIWRMQRQILTASGRTGSSSTTNRRSGATMAKTTMSASSTYATNHMKRWRRQRPKATSECTGWLRENSLLSTTRPSTCRPFFSGRLLGPSLLRWLAGSWVRAGGVCRPIRFQHKGPNFFEPFIHTLEQLRSRGFRIAARECRHERLVSLGVFQQIEGAAVAEPERAEGEQRHNNALQIRRQILIAADLPHCLVPFQIFPHIPAQIIGPRCRKHLEMQLLELTHLFFADVARGFFKGMTFQKSANTENLFGVGKGQIHHEGG